MSLSGAALGAAVLLREQSSDLIDQAWHPAVFHVAVLFFPETQRTGVS